MLAHNFKNPKLFVDFAAYCAKPDLCSGCWATLEGYARRPGRADMLSSPGNLSQTGPWATVESHCALHHEGVAPRGLLRGKNASNALFARGQVERGVAISMRRREVAQGPGQMRQHEMRSMQFQKRWKSCPAAPGTSNYASALTKLNPSGVPTPVTSSQPGPVVSEVSVPKLMTNQRVENGLLYIAL